MAAVILEKYFCSRDLVPNGTDDELRAIHNGTSGKAIYTVNTAKSVIFSKLTLQEASRIASDMNIGKTK